MLHNFHYLPYSKTGFFSGIVNDYIGQHPELRCCYQYTPDNAGIEKAIEERAAYPINRSVLTTVLEQQYKDLPKTDLVTQNLELLKQDNTFTICTAHQPNLMTGFLYFVYKIIHAIRLAEDLNTQHTDKHFVPVYYIGSEDNDLEELGAFRVGNKKLVWDGNGQTGAVGRMNTKSLRTIIGEAMQLAGPPGANYDTIKEIVETAYLKHKTIGAATQYLCNELFGRYGLIVIDPDEALLKKEITSILKDDLINHTAKEKVETTISKLEDKGYKSQAYPRDINLFYLKDQVRERIELQDSIYKVLNTDISFTETELLEELDNHPERFSPNVILRGLLQETILPNIAFIGGGSEVAYWLQLKEVFQHYNVFFPVLLLRQSVQWIDEKAAELRSKLALSIEELFADEHTLLKQEIEKSNGIPWEVTEENTALQNIILQLQQKATSIDPTLEKSAEAALQKIKKQLITLEKKMYRAEKKKHEILQQRIASLKAQIFPNGSLQERYGNLLDLFPQLGFQMFDTLKQATDPLGSRFLVIERSLD